MGDWYLMLSRADLQRSREFAGSALAALESVRPVLPVRDPLTGESTFAVHMQPIFEAAVDADLAESGEQPVAIAEAQQTYEAFREAEIQSVFSDECIPALPPVRPADLRKGEVILYPILLGNRVELIYAAGGEPGFHRLPPNRSINRDQVLLLTATLRAGLLRGDDAWKPASRALYDALIAPIGSKLGPESNLAIVPRRPAGSAPCRSRLCWMATGVTSSRKRGLASRLHSPTLNREKTTPAGKRECSPRRRSTMPSRFPAATLQGSRTPTRKRAPQVGKMALCWSISPAKA